MYLISSYIKFHFYLKLQVFISYDYVFLKAYF